MFERVLGHDYQKSLLENAIKQSKISHSYIFYGIEGIGKFLLAKEFSKALVCQNKNACGSCSHCLEFDKNTVSDFKIIDLSLNKSGEQKDSISVDDIREVVGDVFIKPFYYTRKIYIINNADKMTPNAQNALLKVFEEPPSFTTFILIANNIGNILPTILSRGLQIRFSPLSEKDIEKYLTINNINLKDHYPLTLSNGSIKDAVDIINNNNFSTLRDEIINSFIRLLSENKKSHITHLYGLFLKNEDIFSKMLDILSEVVYDIIVKDNKDLIKNKTVNYSKISNINLKKAYNIQMILSELSKRLTSNASYNLCVLASLIEVNKTVFA